MTETKFTKGPWESKASPFEVYNADHGALNGHVVSGQSMIAAFYEGHNTPDAHLIAAAPDLYETIDKNSLYLTFLLDELQGIAPSSKLKVIQDCIDRSDSALAKARGEE